MSCFLYFKLLSLQLLKLCGPSIFILCKWLTFVECLLQSKHKRSHEIIVVILRDTLFASLSCKRKNRCTQKLRDSLLKQLVTANLVLSNSSVQQDFIPNRFNSKKKKKSNEGGGEGMKGRLEEGGKKIHRKKHIFFQTKWKIDNTTIYLLY